MKGRGNPHHAVQFQTKKKKTKRGQKNKKISEPRPAALSPIRVFCHQDTFSVSSVVSCGLTSGIEARPLASNSACVRALPILPLILTKESDPHP